MARLLEELTTEEKAALVTDVLQKKNGELASDWADIVDEYNLEISGDTLRKAGVGVKLVYDAGMIGAQPNIPPEDGVDYIERQKMRDLVRENNKVYRATARDELLREAVQDAVKKAGIYQAAFVDRDDRTDLALNPSGSMVVALGDIHFGEYMDVRGFVGEVINHYDDQVCKERMGRLLRRIEDIYQREHTRDIHVMLVGDCITGMLRMSQLQNLQYGIVDSTILFSELFAGWVKEIADRTGAHVTVHMVGGNHDEVRPLGSKAGEFPKDNVIKIIHWYLEAKLAGYTVLVTISPLTGRYHYVNVDGYNFLMLHGEGGRIGDLSRDAVNVYGRHVDYFVCGHLHHEEEIASGTTKDGNSIIVRVPSLCGMDGYAQKLGRFSRPGATVLIMQQGVGRRCVYPIDLSDKL